MIALECGGAKILSHLLWKDPSCHLLAIILVNLTFVDEGLREELASRDSDAQVIASLCYALRVGFAMCCMIGQVSGASHVLIDRLHP